MLEVAPGDVFALHMRGTVLMSPLLSRQAIFAAGPRTVGDIREGFKCYEQAAKLQALVQDKECVPSTCQ